jgi:signal transduction histidine kinase
VALIVLTILIDLIFTRLLIRPLAKIIKTKLLNRKFPFKDQRVTTKTSTTDFKYLDESITLLMDQINEAFAKEREFTANASHELMTPISILQNKMENLLGDEQMSESVTLGIIGMMKTLDRLKKISGALLLISRIENEQFVKNDDVKVLILFNDIIEEISHRLEEKNISIGLDISDDIVLKKVNHSLLFQLFYNLINNAIKFNKQDGSILIRGLSLKNGGYEISVIDTGIGIADDQIPYIFDRFRKVNISENAGHGLGLAIVKSIAAYHNLEISIQSKVGKGTTLSVKSIQN